MRMIRVYKFRCLKYGLQALNEKRLKVAYLTDLNDPFELSAVNLAGRNFRKIHKVELKKLSKIRGFISFSKKWNNPVLWAHYADSQKGLCIGFDVPEEHIFEIEYFNKRIDREKISSKLSVPNTTTNNVRELFAKSTYWSYEQEFRIWYDLSQIEYQEDKGLHFSKFCQNLKPVEVIVGPACDIERNMVENAISKYDHDIVLRRARPAFTSFDIVENQQGFV